MIIALARFLGDDTPAPAEIAAVADDILKHLRLVADLASTLRTHSA